MWNRKEVKAKGKESFKRNYWKSVLVAFVCVLLAGGTSASSSRKLQESDMNVLEGLDPAVIAGIFAAIMTIVVVASLLSIFVFGPLKVGCKRFFVVNHHEDAQVNELGYSFKNNYLNAVLALFLMGVLIALGFIVLVIPGIILSYSYRLVPYILADEPGIGAVDALKKSRQLMKGNKWKSFVFDLSFLGWWFLVALTVGILGVFYVNPYYMSAEAALYEAIKAGNTAQ